MHRVSVVAALLLSAAMLWGCASSPLEDRQAQSVDARVSVPEASVNRPYWSYLRFRFARDGQGEAQSFLDPLVADQVLSPPLEAYRTNIRLWRFHRRWPDDETGHQFSLLIYTDAATAQAVVAAVRQNPVLARLAAEGLLREAVFESVFSRQQAEENATSDPIWSPDVQREWPKFIEGASRLWLGLVKAEAERHAAEPLLQRFRSVEEALTQIWFKEANHALFHHLSGLFGYKPVRVISREIMTF